MTHPPTAHRLCTPCARGACEDCQSADHAPEHNPYHCGRSHVRCPAPTGPPEHGYDWVIPDLGDNR